MHLYEVVHERLSGLAPFMRLCMNVYQDLRHIRKVRVLNSWACIALIPVACARN